MLFQQWASVIDDGPALKQHWFNTLCLLGYWVRVDITCGTSLHLLEVRIEMGTS